MAHGDLDPYSVEYTEHHGEVWLSAARTASPVFYDAALEAWCVTRHEDVMDVLRQPTVFSSRNAVELREPWPELEAAYPGGHPSVQALVMSDPPVHTRRRKLINQALTPRAVASLEPQIRDRCERLVASVASAGGCDLVADFAQPLPVQVITDMIGAPRGREREFIDWAGDTFALMRSAPPLADTQRRAIEERGRIMGGWLRGFIEERRRTPTDDICSRLIEAQSDDGSPRFSTAEVVSMVNGLLTAGTHTTTIFITLLVRELLRTPSLRSVAQLGRESLERTVEEGLRMLTPVRTVRRLATETAVIGGTEIPEGHTLLLFLCSANRDEELFSSSDSFDPARERVKSHLSFGKLTHMCIGAPLARLEAIVAVETLFAKLPELRLDGEDADWEPHLSTPRLATLPVAWG